MGKIIQKPSRRERFFRSGLGEFLRLDRNHADRLLDYFRRYPDLRMEVIESIYLSAARSRQAPTRREMIAALVMLASAQPIDQTLRRLERFSLEGWSAVSLHIAVAFPVARQPVTHDHKPGRLQPVAPYPVEKSRH